MDMFAAHSAKAMLTGREGPAFDDPGYLFELKLDGDRCLAYLDSTQTVLINKRSHYVLGHLPELAGIHKQVSQRCILDGELIIGSGYKHEFARIRSRLTTSSPLKLNQEARANPATFLAFDILYLHTGPVLDLPLLERKALLEQTVAEGPRLTLSRFVPERGKAFFDLVSARGLEGIMAKRADSVYRMGKRSPDWMKCKNWDRDLFVICGYVPSEKANVVSLVLGQFKNGALTYVSHVALGRQTDAFEAVTALPQAQPLMEIPWKERGKRARLVWVSPVLVCQVEFLCRTPGGGLRQPIFKGLAQDYEPEEALWPEVFGCSTPESRMP